MKSAWAIFLFVLLFGIPAPAWGEESRPLAEVEALRLEKAEVEIQLLLERADRLRERVQAYVREIARREGVEGWQLDLPHRRWMRPEPAPGRSGE